MKILSECVTIRVYCPRGHYAEDVETLIPGYCNKICECGWLMTSRKNDRDSYLRQVERDTGAQEAVVCANYESKIARKILKKYQATPEKAGT